MQQRSIILTRGVLIGAAVLFGASVVLNMTGCSKKTDKTAVESTTKLRDVPDFGGVKSVYVEAEGNGGSAAEAVDDALLSAVKQVNGAQVQSTNTQLKVAGSLDVNASHIDYNSQEFANLVISKSGGLVSDFKILEPAKQKFGFGKRQWQIKIGAHVSKYQAGADASRPRVVVALPRTRVSQFSLGNGTRSASDVSAYIRNDLSEALSKTNRFTVLDRTVTDQLDKESALIASGEVNQADVSMLGQKLAADLIIIPTIERMEYVRHTRSLRMSDRELVSYSGGAVISFKVINATTGQLVLSETYNADFPSTDPTTLGSHVNGLGVSAEAMAGMTQHFITVLMSHTFPISVIKLSGTDVILGQGGAMVAEGVHYRAVLLGDEMKDPQTGQSLGRTESDFGDILVTRVEANLSYGQLENAPHLSVPFQPGLIEIRDPVRTAIPTPVSHDAVAESGKKVASKANSKAVVIQSSAAASAKPKADSNW